jgi:hypothetical protein
MGLVAAPETTLGIIHLGGQGSAGSTVQASLRRSYHPVIMPAGLMARGEVPWLAPLVTEG